MGDDIRNQTLVSLVYQKNLTCKREGDNGRIGQGVVHFSSRRFVIKDYANIAFVTVLSE